MAYSKKMVYTQESASLRIYLLIPQASLVVYLGNRQWARKFWSVMVMVDRTTSSKRKRDARSIEEKVGILKEVDGGKNVLEVARKLGLPKSTVYDIVANKRAILDQWESGERKRKSAKLAYSVTQPRFFIVSMPTRLRKQEPPLTHICLRKIMCTTNYDTSLWGCNKLRFSLFRNPGFPEHFSRSYRFRITGSRLYYKSTSPLTKFV